MDDPFKYAHEKEEEIIWMSQNTNELETSPIIQREILNAVKKKKYALYPHQKGYQGLKEVLLKDLGVEDGFNGIITSGGIEASYFLTRALLKQGDNVIASDPSFMPIHHQIRLCEAEVKELYVYKDPYHMTVDEINEAVDGSTKAILLIDPLNPLGSSYTREDVKGVCEIAEDNDLWLIDDITYRDFAYKHTLATEFVPERTFLIYSFSKNCGFAGMRLGAVIIPQHMFEEINWWRSNPLSANILAQVGAKVALQTKRQWLPDMLKQSRKNQEIIKKAIDKTDGVHLPVFPSNTNMFVIDIRETGLNPDDIQDILLREHDIFVRGGTYVSSKAGSYFVRVSFTIPEPQVKKFADIFPEVIENMR
ncbi:MAG: pyridoxal phosphate-dependent aminotransferase [Thermoplasmata archaeon]